MKTLAYIRIESFGHPVSRDASLYSNLKYGDASNEVPFFPSELCFLGPERAPDFETDPHVIFWEI